MQSIVRSAESKPGPLIFRSAIELTFLNVRRVRKYDNDRHERNCRNNCDHAATSPKIHRRRFPTLSISRASTATSDAPTTLRTSGRKLRNRFDPWSKRCYTPSTIDTKPPRSTNGLTVSSTIRLRSSPLCSNTSTLPARIFTAFPRRIWTQIWPHNSNGRLNKEVRA